LDVTTVDNWVEMMDDKLVERMVDLMVVKSADKKVDEKVGTMAVMKDVTTAEL